MWRAASPALRRSAAALAVSSGAGVAFGAVASRHASAAAAAPTPPPIKLACIQLSVSEDKEANLLRAKKKVADAAAAGAELVMLPGEAHPTPPHPAHSFGAHLWAQ